MGKVYDALRRAEAEQNDRRVVPDVVAPIERSASRVGEPRRPKASGRLARLMRAFARDPEPVADSGSDINKRRIVLVHPDSFVAEQFRSLRARLDALAHERPTRSIVVTSALPGEGKTTAAVNLALVSAMAVGRKVLLIDCDMRRPRVHGVLGLRPEYGLAEVLTDQVTLAQAICKVEGCTLEVLPVRMTPANPSELLGCGRMRTLLQEAGTQYDQIVLDAPPTLSLPDAKSLSELVDGLVLVIRADQTPEDDVRAALDVLDRRRVLGVVLNGAETDARRYGY